MTPAHAVPVKNIKSAAGNKLMAGKKTIIKNLLLCSLSAFFLSLPFSNGKIYFAAWFGFIPLFFALRNQPRLSAFFWAYSCGVVFWLLTIYWLAHVTLLGTIVLILYLGLYFGFFSFIFLFLENSPRSALFFIPASWVLLEYVRSYLFTGFPWALLGLSQYENLPLIQIASLTGAWGVSYLVMLGNITLYFILRKAQRRIISSLCLLVLFPVLFYGFYRLQDKPEKSSDKNYIKVSVIQGNIPQDLKWDRRAVNFIQNRYQGLSLAAAAEHPDLIIWPEASIPGVWGQDDAEFQKVFALAGGLKTYLLAGAVLQLREDYFNSAMLVNPSGAPETIYSKIHLVPFGEYVPLKKIFSFLQSITLIGDIQPGREYTVFRQPADFSVLICFEDLFPELSRRFVQEGAKFLVNITNDAWYKETSAARQHFAASVFRAVENRVYLARAANTGISGFIDPCGRPLSLMHDRKGKEIFIEGFRSQNIYLSSQPRTIYSLWGDFFVLLCLLLDACVIIWWLAFRRKNNKNP